MSLPAVDHALIILRYIAVLNGRSHDGEKNTPVGAAVSSESGAFLDVVQSPSTGRLGRNRGDNS